MAVLGPVPSVKEQTAELMRDPRWLMQQMRYEAQDEVDGDEVYDWDDDEPELFTGYEVVEMEEFHTPAAEPPPEDKRGQEPEPVQGSTGSEATESPDVVQSE